MDVSFIVPSFKSQRTLPRCALAISHQAGDFTREVIVVDSSPDMREAAAPLPAGMRLVLSEKRLFPGEARNKGLQDARGEYIAFVESDVLLKSDCTARMLEAHGRLAAKHGPHIILSGSL